MNELQSVNVTALIAATIIGSILPFFFGLLYFSIRRELVIRELRKRTEAAKRATGENVVKYKVEIGYEVFLLHKRIYAIDFSKLTTNRKKYAQENAIKELKRQAKAYRQRYNSYTKITIKPF